MHPLKGRKQSKAHAEKRRQGLLRYYAKHPAKPKSEATKEKQRKASNKYWKNRLSTEEGKQQYFKEQSKRSKKRWSEVDDKERKRLGKLISAGWSQASKIKMSFLCRTRANMTVAKGGKWGGGGNNKGCSVSEATKKKISKNHREAIAAGKWLPSDSYTKNGHRREVKTKKGGLIVCHSNWEVIRAKELDNDPLVISFEKDKFRLTYKFKGKLRTYIPDFAIYQRRKKILEEVKPAFRLKLPREKAKVKAAKQWCTANKYTFRIWDLDT